jgi:hypothetical protein
MTEKVPNDPLSENYVINALDCNINKNFLLAMTLLKAEQDKDDKLQEIPGHWPKKDCIRTMTFGRYKST